MKNKILQLLTVVTLGITVIIVIARIFFGFNNGLYDINYLVLIGDIVCAIIYSVYFAVNLKQNLSMRKQ